MKKIIIITISLFLFLISCIFDFSNAFINNILYIISYLLVGLEILYKAFKNLLKGKIFDENFLMSLATIGALIIGEYPEAVIVMIFYQIGELLQDRAIDKSRRSILSLMDIRPDYANVYIDNKVKKVDPKRVKINDIIVIKPGEKVPLDGIIVEGSTNLDTKALTGETIPKNVISGDEVLSGCINQNGLIKIKVTKEYENGTVNKILNLVESSLSKKSKKEKFITKFARYYTPVVVFVGLIISLLVPVILKESFAKWIYRGLSFLVISCPCALVISIPLSFFSGIGCASKMGILIKGGNYLEALKDVDTIVFDKTGTLTKGIFKVSKIKPIGISKDELLEFAVYAENYSTHPIAFALKSSYNDNVDESRIKSVEELTGFGIKANIDNHRVLIGNAKLMKENNIKFDNYSDTGTTLHISVDNLYKGYIVIADEIKEDTKNVISELKQNNIKEIIMLTGDCKEVGLCVAKELDIDCVYTDLLPQDKVSIFEKLINGKSKKGKVAFVGDGINDAPVLALADVGIAMGSLGSDSAIEASDVVIMTDEIRKIVSAIKLSRKTMIIVKENIVFALLVKTTILFLAAFGISTMWEAVFADVGVSLIAILNALRVLKLNKKL